MCISDLAQHSDVNLSLSLPQDYSLAFYYYLFYYFNIHQTYKTPYNKKRPPFFEGFVPFGRGKRRKQGGKTENGERGEFSETLNLNFFCLKRDQVL